MAFIYALYKDGSFIQVENFPELSNLPHYDFIVRKTVVLLAYSRRKSKYEFINESGGLKQLKIGNLTVLQLEWKEGQYSCSLFDDTTKTVREYAFEQREDFPSYKDFFQKDFFSKLAELTQDPEYANLYFRKCLQDIYEILNKINQRLDNIETRPLQSPK